MRDEFLVFGAPQISEAEIDEVAATLRSRWLGTGPRVARFEQDFAAYAGLAADQAAAVSSCTAALHLAMLAAGVGPGDEVITTPMTFCATVNAIVHSGATPVLADIDPVTMNIDPAAVARQVTPRTRAVLPVHFAGLACDMGPLMDIAATHGLAVIEDCAHAIETRHQGRAAGTFGDFGCYSFYVTKNVVTGEGGMVLGRSREAIQRIRRLALHGMSDDAWKRFSDQGYKHYLVEECGFKYNMTDLAAAIGIHQLARVEGNWQRRLEIWQRYGEDLDGLPLTLPADAPAGDRHGLHLFTIRLAPDAKLSRDAFLSAMHGRNIGTGVHYLAIPEHPYYQQRFGWQPDDFPAARDAGRQCVSLPLSAALSDTDVTDVVDAVRALLA